MARPTDRDEAKTATLNIRVTPSFKARLEAHAKIAGRKLSADAEARLVQSIEQAERKSTPQTRALLDEIEKLIEEIEIATDSKWHQNIGAWAAVVEMLASGPIMTRAPEQSGDNDAKLLALYDTLEAIRVERGAIADRLSFAGLMNAMIPYAGADAVRTAVDQIEIADPELRARALGEADRLGELEALERTTLDEIDALVEPFREAIAEGASLYEKPTKRGFVLSAALGRISAAKHERGSILPLLRAAHVAAFQPRSGMFGSAGPKAVGDHPGLLPSFKPDAAKE